MELERKYQVAECAPYKQTAQALGFAMTRKTHQEDTYFILNKPFPDGTRHYLRIREDKLTHTLSLGYHRVLDTLATEEIEQPIQRKADMVQTLHWLGYDAICVVHKVRETYVKDNINLIFDDVQALGLFIEVEMEAPPAEEHIRALDQVIEELRLSELVPIERQGYPDLLLAQK